MSKDSFYKKNTKKNQSSFQHNDWEAWPQECKKKEIVLVPKRDIGHKMRQNKINLHIENQPFWDISTAVAQT